MEHDTDFFENLLSGMMINFGYKRLKNKPESCISAECHVFSSLDVVLDFISPDELTPKETVPSFRLIVIRAQRSHNLFTHNDKDPINVSAVVKYKLNSVI